MKNSNDTIGNRTRDLPVCSAVPQPTAPPAACPLKEGIKGERTMKSVKQNGDQVSEDGGKKEKT